MNELSRSVDARTAMDANRRHWDELASRHARTAMYANKFDRLRQGHSSLRQLERDDVGDVRGRSLLHLQCHLGTESIGWAKLGATVTAVDFSAAALRQAQRFAGEFGVDVRFVQANVMELGSVLHEQFDIVYTSWGVLGWLPDLTTWASSIADLLRPGGFVYIAEFHPLAWVFDEDASTPALKYDYFGTEPLRDDHDGSYADREMRVEHRTTYGWYYTIAGAVSSLCAAGLRIEFLHELQHMPYQAMPFLLREDIGDEAWYRMPEGTPALPLAFTLRARREAP